MKLPEEFIEIIRQYSEQEDDAKMLTAKVIAEYWLETGKAIAHHRKESEKSAHRWFIEATAAEVGMHHSSLYNRSRVGRNIILRGYSDKHPDIGFGAWLELLRNAPEDDGLVPESELAERLIIYYNIFDQYGKPPSVRDIKKIFVKNGDKKEWEQYWSIVEKNCGRLLKLEDTPEGIIEWLMDMPGVEAFIVPVDCGGSGKKEK